MDLIVGPHGAIDIETEEILARKAGGKFALTTLLQKRTVELTRGAPPLVRVEPGEHDVRKIACREILEGKIALGPEETQAEEYARVEGTRDKEGHETHPAGENLAGTVRETLKRLGHSGEP